LQNKSAEPGQGEEGEFKTTKSMELGLYGTVQKMLSNGTYYKAVPMLTMLILAN
jgi:hypothetical protein